MKKIRVALTLLLTGVCLLSGTLFGPGASGASLEVNSLFGELAVAPEEPVGYDRGLFPHWIDADGDGCNTRQEVLKAESLTPVVIGSGCVILEGTWYSWYDDVTETDPSRLDIDHVIPLNEAWRSGAHAWSTEQRTAFANDLDYEWSLEAVTAGSNRSKGDRDPADWMPPYTEKHCQYASVWVAVKYRWRLSIDPAEHSKLASVLATDQCGEGPIEAPVRAIPPPPDPEVPDPEDPEPIVFHDVPPTHTFGDEIYWLAGEGVTTGYEDGTYRPRTQISREAMAAFMYRLAERDGHPSVVGYAPPAVSRFPDVPSNHTFYREISWLASQQITTGYTDGTFRPRTRISREAMAAFMHRYAKLTGRPTSGMVDGEMMVFDDVVPKHTFHREITWMGVAGISTGYAKKPDCQDFRPRGKVTREAMAAFMHRLATGEGEGLNRGCVTPPPNPGDIKNCSDFMTWGEANAWFMRYYPFYGDVARLDGDNDGVPCESLPRR